MNEILNSLSTRVLTTYLGLFLLTTGVSWAGFTFLSGGTPGGIVSPVGLENKRGQIVNAPKTELCPLNGAKYSRQEREIWSARRPLAVMIENHTEARPQSGLSQADIVYEAVAEGGITRFMAIFYCGASAEELKIGPVRSARIYFMDWAAEYSDWPLYTHVGGANRAGPADALGKIAQLGWISQGNDLNQFSISFPVFEKDPERLKRPDGSQVATEHTMYAFTDKLWGVAAGRGLTEKNNKGDRWDKNFVPWKFNEEEPQGKSALSVEFPFWNGQSDFIVKWSWDPEGKVYKRENGGETHADFNTKKQIEASTVVVQFVSERALHDPEKHMIYSTAGKGKALVFRNGKVIEANWQKGEMGDRTIFTDRAGKEVEFSPGKIWIEALPVGTDVSY